MEGFGGPQKKSQEVTMKMMDKIIGVSLLASALNGSFLYSNFFDEEFQRIDRYFDSLMKERYYHFGDPYEVFPKMNMMTKNNTYVIEFNVAGIAKNDLKVSIEEGNILKIEGVKKEPKEDKSKKVLKQEIFYGNFTRMVQLPNDSESQKISVEYKNGTLVVTIPMKESKKSTTKILEIK